MKLLPVCLLAAGWVVLNVPFKDLVHCVKKAPGLESDAVVKTAWTLSGTSLAINSPCAAQLEINPASGPIRVTASSPQPADLAVLQVKSGANGVATVSASACPDTSTFSTPFKITITLPPGTPVSITENGSTDYVIGDLGSDLTIQSQGSGDITAGQMRNITVALRGAGDAQIASVTGIIAATLSGAGDLHIDTADATRTALTLTADGDVKIDDGNTGTLTADMSGHGDVSLPDAASLQIMDRGDGDVTVGNVTGTLNAVLNGSGDLHSGVVAGDAALVLNGNGDADVAHVGGKLSQTTNGSGDVTIGQ